MSPDHLAPLIAVLGVSAAAAWLLRPLFAGLARRLEGRPAAVDLQLQGELDELRHRVAESERLEARVAELEERLDFTERLLSQNRQGLLSEGRER